MTRYTRELRVRYVGDAALGQVLLPEARKYVAQVDTQRQGIGPGASLSRRVVNAAGAVFDVAWVGDQPTVTIDVSKLSPKSVEEVIHLFVTGSEGLEVIDIGSKQLIAHVDGLADYEVDGVARNGKLVFVTGDGTVVRADLEDESAFGAYYQVLDVDTGNNYFGYARSCRLSRDETRLAVGFDQTLREDGLVRDGLGGLIMADAETLTAVRSPIRMGVDPCAAWGDDGRLFSAARITSDTGYPDPAVLESVDEYIAVHAADGTLAGTVLVASGGGMIPGGAANRIRAIAARGRRLFVLLQKDPFDAGGAPQLLMYSIEDPDLLPTFVAGTNLPFSASDAGRSIATHHFSKVVVPLVNASDGDLVVVDVVVEDDIETLEVVETIARPEFSMVAVGGISGIDTDALQAGPKSRHGNEPDTRWFFLDKTGDGALRAFRNLASEEAEYTLDLADYTINKRFRLIVAGERPRSAA